MTTVHGCRRRLCQIRKQHWWELTVSVGVILNHCRKLPFLLLNSRENAVWKLMEKVNKFFDWGDRVSIKCLFSFSGHWRLTQSICSFITFNPLSSKEMIFRMPSIFSSSSLLIKIDPQKKEAGERRMSYFYFAWWPKATASSQFRVLTFWYVIINTTHSLCNSDTFVLRF